MAETVRQGVLIELLGPMIPSAGVATAANPQALPYIPGAMLWGIAASKRYGADPDLETTFDRVHGGNVRFGDGLPLSYNGPGFAVPMSLHLPKGVERGAILSQGRDWAIEDRSPGHSQQRGWSVGPGLVEVTVKCEASMRTAIDPTTGMAAAGQLYTLQALSAGQSFIAVVEGEDAAAVEDAIGDLCGVKVADGPGETGEIQFLGRSKSAEFGKARLSRARAWTKPGQVAGPARYLWCLSDLAAFDKHGVPTDRPDDGFFAAAIDWARSFARSRRYSPYNAKWQARVPERLVIERGSVFTLAGGIAPGLHQFGLHQEVGLGQVFASVEPPLRLLKGNALRTLPIRIDAPERVTKATGLGTLAGWLQERAAELDARLAAEKNVNDAVQDWMAVYEKAMNLNGERVGPGPSQWGPLGGVADLAASLVKLGAEENHARESKIWQARFEEGINGTFVAKAQEYLGSNGNRDFAVLAKAIRAMLIKLRWFDGK